MEAAVEPAHVPNKLTEQLNEHIFKTYPCFFNCLILSTGGRD